MKSMKLVILCKPISIQKRMITIIEIRNGSITMLNKYNIALDSYYTHEIMLEIFDLCLENDKTNWYKKSEQSTNEHEYILVFMSTTLCSRVLDSSVGYKDGHHEY